MTLACPVGHPSAEGQKNCPLCGRKYVRSELVVLPPTKDEVLSEWRARRRAAKAGAAQVATAETPATGETAETPATALPTETVIPSARTAGDDAEPTAPEAVQETDSTTWTHTPIEVQAKLLTVGAAAMFVSAFALGESVMALNLMS